jgi:hypothetical protein
MPSGAMMLLRMPPTRASTINSVVPSFGDGSDNDRPGPDKLDRYRQPPLAMAPILAVIAPGIVSTKSNDQPRPAARDARRFRRR